ncbi:hypothetical protein L6452_39283 [Arctium lappa]|uniref:Uncharacterized protein n=1 Tax=Arctium lappa TaxID=4217 RepID=A0ACB8XSA7_ARCLA|nr:hypothetical protein L6452_39283 [Arctium lappa]
MFRVRLDNEDIILGYVSGKIRRSFIRILPGDRVKIEMYGGEWFLGPLPVLVASEVQEEGRHLLLKPQREMLFVQ